MRKACGLLATFCSAMLLAASFSIGANAATYDTKQTEAIKGTPTIDGKMDDIWKKANKIDVNMLNKTLIPSNSTTTAEAYTMWDDQNFYFFAVVKDSHVSDKGGSVAEDKDSVEIQVDEKNSKGKGNVSAGNAAAGCFRVDVNGATSGFGDKYNADKSKFKSAAVKTDTGYIVEAAIPFTSITPKADAVIAMEIQINDNMADSGRSGLISWNSDACLGWSDTEAMGEVKLVEGAAGGDTDTDNPKTGEELPVAGLALLAVSAAVTGGCLTLRKKK